MKNYNKIFKSFVEDVNSYDEYYGPYTAINCINAFINNNCNNVKLLDSFLETKFKENFVLRLYDKIYQLYNAITAGKSEKAIIIYEIELRPLRDLITEVNNLN